MKGMDDHNSHDVAFVDDDGNEFGDNSRCIQGA
jgi:hypothetical protein